MKPPHRGALVPATGRGQKAQATVCQGLLDPPSFNRATAELCYRADGRRERGETYCVSCGEGGVVLVELWEIKSAGESRVTRLEVGQRALRRAESVDRCVWMLLSLNLCISKVMVCEREEAI